MSFSSLGAQTVRGGDGADNGYDSGDFHPLAILPLACFKSISSTGTPCTPPRAAGCI